MRSVPITVGIARFLLSVPGTSYSAMVERDVIAVIARHLLTVGYPTWQVHKYTSQVERVHFEAREIELLQRRVAGESLPLEKWEFELIGLRDHLCALCPPADVQIWREHEVRKWWSGLPADATDTSA